MASIKPILPGEILEEEFLTPMGISAYKLAKDIKISATRVSEILKGKRRITIDTALRLSKYFGNSVEFWVGIQADYEIRKAKKDLGPQLAEIQQLETKIA
jgi:antitoxin HigA-1